MDDRFNMIAMAALGAGVVALGSTLFAGEIFHSERPEKPGYVIEGVEDAAGGAAAAVPIETLLATADPAKGADVFKKCAACHNAESGGANAIGPNLWGVVGKPHAAHPGFAYSEALKGKPGNWDFANLNEWLTSPRAYANGTKMTFAGLSKPEDRANVIAYLNKQGSNLPLPAAPAAGTAATTAKPTTAEAAAQAKAGTKPGGEGAPANAGAAKAEAIATPTKVEAAKAATKAAAQ